MTTARARAWAVDMNAADIAAAERSTDGDGRYEERRATTLPVGAFLTDVLALVAAEDRAAWPQPDGLAET